MSLSPAVGVITVIIIYLADDGMTYDLYLNLTAGIAPPCNMTLAWVAQQEVISKVILFNWRSQANAEEKPVPGAEKK